MKIRLLKDHILGKQNEVIDVDEKKGNYLVRMKVAEIELEKYLYGVYISDPSQLVDVEDMVSHFQNKEKHEFTPENEKQEHEGLPTAKKRGRKPKQ